MCLSLNRTGSRTSGKRVHINSKGEGSITLLHTNTFKDHFKKAFKFSFKFNKILKGSSY